ncbi:MAG: TIGR00303 family protein [Deltaproteobacteria bacterium]|nr:TIGR00303 family protein [Candidatus Anaeroferrophillus wilburensis]MBN2889551.1 TIGR00303 family protein [Deltaproteobacteria bacterium]
MSHPDIITVTDDQAAAADFLQHALGRPPLFICTIATTETAAIPGISAAGANAELIRYTAAADVEALYYGRARCLEKIPENPSGPPSPVIITMAAQLLLSCPTVIVDAGNSITPQVPLLVAGRTPGKAITDSLPVENVHELLLQGMIIGENLGLLGHTLIIGESVPGGTTTALSLMEGLGLDSFGKISGSMPGNNPSLKEQVVTRAMVDKGLIRGSLATDPLAAVALLGDPMQVVQAGMALAASHRTPVLLGGGSQMLAVAALIGAMMAEKNIDNITALHQERVATVLRRAATTNIAVATTGWVSEDPHADIRGLARQLPTAMPMFAARLNFSASRHRNLQLYEQGFVKEGVGAGAMALAAMLYRQLDNHALLPAIEVIYERIYLSK